MKKFLYNLFSEKAISIVIIIFFGLTFLSIPLFSFNEKLYLLTWLFTITLLIFVFLSFILYKPIKITIISICFIAFIFFAFISSLLTGFVSFSFTPILNTLIVLILYTYFISQNKNQRHFCLSSVFLSLIIFSLIFAFRYRSSIISGNFFRLGSDFGDENDISIIFSLGYSFSFYYVLYNKKWIWRIINVCFALMFSGLAFVCGSKISIIIILLVSFIVLIKYFGKKRWYLSIIIIVVILGTIVIALQLPAFETLKDRFLNMLYTFVGKQYKGLNPDNSTAGRLEMILNGLSLFLRRPLFGFGTNGYHVFSTHHSGWSHNHWADSLCNYGIVGTIAYHIPFIILLSRTRKEKTFSFIGVSFFLVSTISIALFKEKMFTYLIGLLFSSANVKTLGEISFIKFLHKNNSETIKSQRNKDQLNLIEMIPSLDPVGGAETMFVNLCESIESKSNQNINLLIVILYDKVDNHLSKRIEKLSSNVVYLGKHRGIDFGCAHRLSDLLADFSPDIIHSHLGTSLTLMLALKFRRKYRIVHTFHHMVGTGFKKEVLNMTLIKKNVITPIAVSKQSSLSIEKKTHLPCSFIDNGVNLSFFDDTRCMEDRKIDFLCVGSFTRIKNQLYLIDIFKNNDELSKKHNLYFAGDGPLINECVNSSGELVRKSIFFLGAVDNVPELMSKSKILLLPSISEGNPMVINEAFVSGMYVIANNVGGIPDLIIDGANGDLIDVNDSFRFANCMINRIDDIAFLEDKRVRNSSLLQSYSIDNTANKYLEIFYDLCGTNPLAEAK